jgi:hypothetical protein
MPARKGITMTRANYDRNQSGNAVVYDIVPIPASKATAFGSGSAMLVGQTIVIFLLGLIPAFVIGSFFGGLSSLVILLIAVAIPVFFVRWMRSYKARTLGTRQEAQVSIQDNAVRISRQDGTVTVPAGKVRRLLIGNTYDKNCAPDPMIVTSNASAGQVAGAAIRANIDQKLPQFCFSLELQYGNESRLIADGLDELTVSNLLDDMSKDLQMQ